jgi:hypothetical protein
MTSINNLSVSRLRYCKLDELEALFATDGPVRLPTGCYRGALLTPLPTRGARTPTGRFIGAAFATAPFGVDFRTNAWFFFHPRLQIGRFEPRVGPSRWRDTDAVALHYQHSRLPGPIRDTLYDEVKPLTDTLCLGLGGVNAERGDGDMFVFALERFD